MGSNSKFLKFRDDEWKQRYVSAYRQFRSGHLTEREFAETTVEILLMFVDVYEMIEPHYNDMQKLAQEALVKSVQGFPSQKLQPRAIAKRQASKFVDELKRQYVLDYCAHKAGSLSLFKFNQGLYGVLLKLLNACDALEPYFGEFQTEAEKRYQELLINPPPGPKPNIITNPKVAEETNSAAWDQLRVHQSANKKDIY